jgi:cytochrome oxidase Cu insertion factor (SCO1/SenC/PrrC family)
MRSSEHTPSEHTGAQHTGSEHKPSERSSEHTWSERRGRSAGSYRMAELGLAPLLLLVLLLACGCDPASASGTSDSSLPITGLSVDAPTIDFALPDFELIDQHKQPFKKSQMAGDVWVTNFIFTSCPSVCPRLTERMATLVTSLADQPNVRFLSISVDPETDTPDKLAAFGAQHGAGSPRWSFVTGDPKLVEQTVLKGFLMVMQRGATPMDISHAERFVVVDKKSHVRGLYETDDAGLAALKARVLELLREPG